MSLARRTTHECLWLFGTNLFGCLASLWLFGICLAVWLCLAVWQNSTSTAEDVRAREQIKCLQHTATHCNNPQHAATYCNTLQYTVEYMRAREQIECVHNMPVEHTATHRNTLHHAATNCNTLQHRVCARERADQISAQHAHSTHCNTPQNTATHCNTEYVRARKQMACVCNMHIPLQHTCCSYGQCR